MPSMNRRSFLKKSLAAAGVAPFLASHPWAAPIGANEKIRICLMGVKQRGKQQVDAFLRIPEVEIACICDVDKAVGGVQVDRIAKHPNYAGKAPRFEQDIRKVLEDKTIHAVSIATPNHWHSLGTYLAVQAEKDVLCEKPCSHNIWEGRQIVKWAREKKCIVQHTTQYRSAPGIRAAIKFMHEGKLGKVTLARALVYKPKKALAKVEGEQPIPEGVDYDLWLGPAPKVPLTRKSLHYDWHFFWEYGNGEIGNQGVHMIDICRWGLQKELPTNHVSWGGRYGGGDGEVADTQMAVLDYGDGCRMIVEVSNILKTGLQGIAIGEIFYGTEGHLTIGHYGDATAFLKGQPPVVLGKALSASPSATDYDNGHFKNFLQAMRDRKVEEQYADILEGHLTCAHIHLANMSYRLGKEATFKPRPEAFAADKDAAEAIQRMEQDLGPNRATKFTLGKTLNFDPKTETCNGDADANKMLRREYREPFAIKEKV